MSTNASNWNESLINEWAETQRKYWETWSDYAKNAGMGAFGAGNGQSSAANPDRKSVV